MENFRLWTRAENRDGSHSVRSARSQRVVHSLNDVGVGVEGDVYAGVAELLLNVPGVLVCHEEYCSAGVAEIMGSKRQAVQVSLAIDRTRRVWDVLAFPAPVDFVGEAQGAVKVGRMSLLSRAYGDRAAITFESPSGPPLAAGSRGLAFGKARASRGGGRSGSLLRRRPPALWQPWPVGGGPGRPSLLCEGSGVVCVL